MTLEALALLLSILCAAANLPNTCCSRHVLLFRLFPVACSTSLLFPETTGSTKPFPVLPTYKTPQVVMHQVQLIC